VIKHGNPFGQIFLLGLLWHVGEFKNLRTKWSGKSISGFHCFLGLYCGPRGPGNHFSVTKTIPPDLWSFCCPDLYILIKVLQPFKL
jgi:hypothetical protein